GAGIGGGHSGSGGTNVVEAARVRAIGGALAAGIGSGGGGANGGEIDIRGGTVRATGGESGNSLGTGAGTNVVAGTVRITGGTVFAPYTDPRPTNASTNFLYALTIETGARNALVTNLFFSAAAYYEFKGMYADGNGDLTVWLPPTDNEVRAARIALDDGTLIDFYYAVTTGGGTYWGYILSANGQLVFSAMDGAGSGWTYCSSNHTLLLDDAAVPVTLSGEGRNGYFNIVVPAGGAGQVTLAGLTLVSSASAERRSPFIVSNACELAFSGENSIEALGAYSAGIEVAKDAALTLNGEGTLRASGGRYGAGIGSSGDGSVPLSEGTPGRIVMAGGTVYAYGGESAAGVGGGSESTLVAGGISVTGGRLYAYGGESAAGVGAGKGKFEVPDGAVAISGGTVVAYGARSNVQTSELMTGASQSDFAISRGNTVSTMDLYRTLVVTGGSAVPACVGAALPRPVDASGTRLYGVSVSNLAANAACSVSVSPLPAGYRLDGIYASPEGMVCLWLPQGDYTVSINGARWTASVTGSNTAAVSVALVSAPVPVSRIAASASGVSLTVPLTAVSDVLRSRGVETQAAAPEAGVFRIYASPSLPFPDPPGEVDVSQCTLTDNGDGTATVSIPLAGPEPQMFFKVVCE
ncbi:MAG: hypothetical protein IJI73_03900, partial [Kiritimatiellae bacterium]|nr:hypothetical protein [Kiritimatiellia bacterium]